MLISPDGPEGLEETIDLLSDDEAHASLRRARAEWIRTDEPVLAAYLEVVAELLRRRGHRLDPGPMVDALPDPPGLRRESSAVATLSPGVRRAATMFGLNLRVWGDDPFVRADHGGLPERLGAELAALAAAPDRDGITWGMRQIAYRA